MSSKILLIFSFLILLNQPSFLQPNDTTYKLTNTRNKKISDTTEQLKVKSYQELNNKEEDNNSFDKSISVLNTVFSIFQACLAILALVIAIGAFLGFRGLREFKKSINKMGEDAKVVGAVIENLKNQRTSLSNELQDVNLEPIDATPKEIIEKADEVNDHLKLLEMFGVSLTARDYKNRAIDLFYKSKLTLSLEAINKAIELEPNNYDFWHKKGNILDEMKKYAEGIDAYKKAAEIRPDAANSWSAMGVSYTRMGNYDEALACYQNALHANPYFKLVHINIGFTLGLQKNYAEALSAYEKAVALNPKHPYAWNNKGFILSMLNYYDEAIADFELAINLLPNYPRAHYNLARMYSRKNQTFEALKYLKIAFIYDFHFKNEAKLDEFYDFTNLKENENFQKLIS